MTLDITYLSVMLYIKLLLVNILPFSPHSSRGGWSSRDVQLLLSYYISFLIVTGLWGEGGKEAGIEKPLFVLGLLIGESFASPTLI